MTDRDRLIELIKQGEDNTPCEKDPNCDCTNKKCRDCEKEGIADHLLANGVIVPPCKVGDKVCSLIFQKGNIFSHFLEEIYVGVHLSNAPDLRGHRRKKLYYRLERKHQFY